VVVSRLSHRLARREVAVEPPPSQEGGAFTGGKPVVLVARGVSAWPPPSLGGVAVTEGWLFVEALLALRLGCRLAHGRGLFVGGCRCWCWVVARGCHGYIPEEYMRALYPYPLRIRAEDAYPKCIMLKSGEVISILSDKNCETISDPYPSYESQDTGIYNMMKLLAPAEFLYNTVDLSFRVPTIEGFICTDVAPTSGDPARPRRNRSITRLDPLALS